MTAWLATTKSRNEKPELMLDGARKHKNRRQDGFTLIELLVVVLILGILMAIAIPTFLSLTGGAKSNAAEADLTTAAQDEGLYLTTNGDFDGTTAGATAPTAAANISAAAIPAGMIGADPGLNWTVSLPTIASAGKKMIYVDMISTTSAAAIILGTAGQNGNYYWVYDNSGALSYDYTTTIPAAAPATPTTAAPWGLSWKTATNLA